MTDLHPFADSALAYTEAGHTVLPVGADKRPLVSTRNWKRPPAPQTVAEWARQKPGANIGIHAGLSRLVCLDVDSRDADVLGDLVERFGQTPAQVVTPGRGVHLWYRATGNERSRNLRRFGIPADIKAGNSFAIAPPSRTDAGEYQGRASRADFIEALRDPPTFNAAAMAAIEGRQSVVPAAEGERNSRLFAAARSIVAWCNTLDTLINELRQINATYTPPLPADEVVRIAGSVWRYHCDGKVKAPGGGWSYAQFWFDEIAPLFGQGCAAELWMYIKTRQAPDHVFAISPKGLAPQLRRNARTVADARNLLTSLGYVVLLHKGRRKGDASRYRYGTLADRRAHRVQNEYPIEHYTPAPSDEGQQQRRCASGRK